MNELGYQVAQQLVNGGKEETTMAEQASKKGVVGRKKLDRTLNQDLYKQILGYEGSQRNAPRNIRGHLTEVRNFESTGKIVAGGKLDTLSPEEFKLFTGKDKPTAAPVAKKITEGGKPAAKKTSEGKPVEQTAKGGKP